MKNALRNSKQTHVASLCVHKPGDFYQLFFLVNPYWDKITLLCYYETFPPSPALTQAAWTLGSPGATIPSHCLSCTAWWKNPHVTAFVPPALHVPSKWLCQHVPNYRYISFASPVYALTWKQVQLQIFFIRNVINMHKLVCQAICKWIKNYIKRRHLLLPPLPFPCLDKKNLEKFSW